MTAAAASLHRSLGLTDDELERIREILGREPNPLELAMYAVMWSEHCSYKSSRIHLGRLPTEAPWVLVGPGENAGVVDVGDGLAAALRIESHNHPSYIEPYQGAATGVGGIIRDIFTMGARPVALMDPLRFGSLDSPRARWIAEGVVAGISGYGNAVGVPTVGGEVVFDATYDGNPLVNVLCLGLLPHERLVLGQASGPGNLAVLLGSSTGRDGIGGVSVLASAGFAEEEDSAKRPSVQVGDPYEEKRLIEACLELLEAGLVVGIQDLGGAGLTCATSETASRGGTGMDVDVSAVPRREAGMEPFEVMTSESQERMLAIVTPDSLPAVQEICDRWEIRAAVVGRVTDDGMLRIREGFDGPVLAEVPAASLHDDAPRYDRPRRAPDPPGPSADELPPPADPAAEVAALVADTSWVWRQYDHQLFCNTVIGPGHDATLLRLRHPETGEDTGRALALTTDGNHAWCAVDPRRGTALVLAEAVANLACVGARPLAVVNCLNFGNPEHPTVMWQLSEAVDGLAEGCSAFGLPVIGGNVSLYNETAGADIDPSPVVGVLGLTDALRHRPPGARLVPDAVVLVAGGEPELVLGGSAYGRRHGAPGGTLPGLDPAAHRRTAGWVAGVVADGRLLGVHDVSTGGLAAAVAEMACTGEVGLAADGPGDHRWWLSESPGRFVVVVPSASASAVEAEAADAGVELRRLGVAGGDELRLGTFAAVPLGRLRSAWAERIPAALGSGTVSS